MVTSRNPGNGTHEAVFGPAMPGDLDALEAMDSGSPRPWTRRAFVEELERDPPSLFTLRFPAELVGFVVARTQVPDLDIVNLAVSPGFRGRGLGRRLLRSLLDHAAARGVRSVFLEVRDGNLEARHLYRGLGFEETQRRPGFYTEPEEDAILMRLELGPGSRLKGPRNAC